MAQKKITAPQLDITSVEGAVDIDNLLPSQTGNNGKVLGTDGTVASWVTAGGGSSSNTYKEAVRVATTANGTLSTAFANGQTIDGVTLATNDRILIKNQTTASDNGIYTVNASGAPTRATDFDTTGAEVANGAIIPVQFGTVNGGSAWQLVQNGGTIGNNFRFAPVNGVAVAGHAAWSATPVASGSGSLAAGPAASASALYALAIGNEAVASGSNSLSLGSSSTAAGTSTVAIGGASLTGTGAAKIGIGATSTWSGTAGDYAILIGAGTGNNSDSTAGQGRQTVLVGRFAQLSGQSASNVIGNAVGLGNRATVEFTGEITFGVSYLSAQGDAKISVAGLRAVTTSATPVEVGSHFEFTGSTTNTTFIVLTNDSSYIFDCDIIARNTATDTESKAWNVKFAIRRGTSAANTALIGTATKTVIGEDTGTSGWDVSVTADTTNGRPNISVTGEAAKTIRWVANIRMTKVTG
jgi:hypothetical protein